MKNQKNKTKKSIKKSSKATKQNKILRLFGTRKYLLLIFVVIFGAIGAYFVFRSDAATVSPVDEMYQTSRLNHDRQNKGLGQLGIASCLTERARAHSQWMADNVSLTHSNGKNTGMTLDQANCGGNWKAGAENIGRGPGTVEVYNALVASSEHYANMFNGGYTRVGIGAARSSRDGQLYVTQLFANCTDCGGGWSQNPYPYYAPDESWVALSNQAGTNNSFKASNWGTVSKHGGGTAVQPGWKYQNIIRSAAQNSGGGGYFLDLFGGLHGFNWAPGVSGGNGPYWWGQDIARDVKLIGSSNKGYVLDGYGGIHPFCGGSCTKPAGPASGQSPYWPGWDIANKMVLRYTGTSTVNGGYVLTGLGSVHPFALNSTSIQASWKQMRGVPTFPSDLARSMAMNPSATKGYVLDAYGGLHPFCTGSTTCSKPPARSGGYWPGWDIIRDIVVTDWSGYHGYVLDGLGGVHNF